MRRTTQKHLIPPQAWTSLCLLGIAAGIARHPSLRASELTILSAETRDSSNRVTVVFSAPVDPASAADTANYVIDHGVLINSAVLIEAAKVRLTTTPLPESQVFTLAVSGVRERTQSPDSIPANSQFTFVPSQGFLTRKTYDRIWGTSLSDLTNYVYFPHLPSSIGETPDFETSVDIGDHYGVLLQGFLTAPLTGQYTFYISSDDQGALFLSTDEAPANKRLIAFEPEWNGPRQWLAPERRPNRENVSAPLYLEAGRRYYVEGIMKEQDGGDNFAVAWRKPGESEIDERTPPISSAFLSSRSSPSKPSAIVLHPQDRTVEEGLPASFSVTVDGTPPHDYQWYQDGQMLVGENGPKLTLPRATPDLSGSRFQVVCGNVFASLRSAEAVLTVVPDRTPPEIVSVEGQPSLNQVHVVFSKPINAQDATDLSKYRLDGGLTLIGATLWGNQRLVLLETSPQTPGASYTLAADGIRDLACNPNPLAPGSQRPFTGFHSVPLPSLLPEGFERVTVSTRSGPVTVVIPRRQYEFRPLGNIYYIATDGDDSHAGEFDSPWRTFGHAVPLLQPGDCLYVREGIYEEPFVVRQSGYPGRPVIISAYPRERVLIRPPRQWSTEGRSGSGTILLDRVKYVWIHGFEIEGYPTEYGPVPGPNSYENNCITFTGGQSGAGEGCQILNNICSKAQHCGIKDQTGNRDYLIEGNICFDNGINGLDHGMYLGSRDCRGTVVRGNATFRNAGFGLHFYLNPDHAYVYNNVSFENAAGGIVESGHKNLIAHNVCARSKDIAGIWLVQFGDASANTFLNNILTGNFNNQFDVQLNDPSQSRGNVIDFSMAFPAAGFSDPPFLPWLGSHWILADPLFEDPAANDYRLRPGSPGRGAGSEAPLLGARPQFDMGLFSATNYWDPAWNEIPDQTVAEGEELVVQPSLVEEVPDGIIMRYRLGPPLAPSGTAVDPDTGRLTWVPSDAQGPGEYSITIVAEANGSPSVSSAVKFRVSVTEANEAPVLGESVPVARTSFDANRDFGYPADPWRIGQYSFFDYPGNPAVIGSASVLDDQSIEMKTSGDWPGTSMHFAYSKVDGDFDLRIRVAELEALHVNSRAGIIAKENLEPESPFVGVFVTGPPPAARAEYHLIYRTNFEQGIANWPGPSPSAAVPFPNGWIRLTRRGMRFTAYCSSDGTSWTLLNEVGVPRFSSQVPLLAGFGALAYTDGVLEVRFTDYQLACSILNPVRDRTLAEDSLLQIQFGASDSDYPAQSRTYSLPPGSPEGALIESETGLFSWRPTESQGPGAVPITIRVTDQGSPPLSAEHTFTVTLSEINQAPQIDPIPNQTASENVAFHFQPAATDPDLPANTLRWSLGENAPSEMAIDAATGAIRWTPTEAQGSSVHSIAVTVTDDGEPPLSDSKVLSIAVEEANTMPELPALADCAIDELTQLTFETTATDSDLPTQSLSMSLADGAPEGATISSSGTFRWTPSESQGPGVYRIAIQVTDDGTPALSAEQVFNVAVAEVNSAPQLAAIPDQTVTIPGELRIAITPADLDLPANELVFSLGENAPEGASISESGLFLWAPALAQAGSTYSISIVATDNGAPPLSARTTFQATIALPAAQVPLLSAKFQAGMVAISFETEPGRAYQLQCRRDLGQDLWEDEGEPLQGDGHPARLHIAAEGLSRFLRIEVK